MKLCSSFCIWYDSASAEGKTIRMKIDKWCYNSNWNLGIWKKIDAESQERRKVISSDFYWFRDKFYFAVQLTKEWFATQCTYVDALTSTVIYSMANILHRLEIVLKIKEVESDIRCTYSGRNICRTIPNLLL